MKTLTKVTIVLAATMMSVGAHAASAIDTVNTAAIKSSLSAEQIKGELDGWKASELLLVEERAEGLTDRNPMVVREAMVRNEIEMEYRRVLKQFDL